MKRNEHFSFTCLQFQQLKTQQTLIPLITASRLLDATLQNIERKWISYKFIIICVKHYVHSCKSLHDHWPLIFHVPNYLYERPEQNLHHRDLEKNKVNFVNFLNFQICALPIQNYSITDFMFSIGKNEHRLCWIESFIQ